MHELDEEIFPAESLNFEGPGGAFTLLGLDSIYQISL